MRILRSWWKQERLSLAQPRWRKSLLVGASLLTLVIGLESLRRGENAQQQAAERQRKDLDLLQWQVRDTQRTSQDWAHWDSSLAFTEGRNPSFPSNDMGLTALITDGAVMAVFGSNGNRLAVVGATAEDRRDGSALSRCLRDVDQQRRRQGATHIEAICPGEGQVYVGNLESISDNAAVRRTNASLAYLVPMLSATDHSPMALAMQQLSRELVLQQPRQASEENTRRIEPILWTSGPSQARVRPPQAGQALQQELLALAALITSGSLLTLGLRLQWMLGQRRLLVEQRQQQRATSQRIRRSEQTLATLIDQISCDGDGDESGAFARLLEQEHPSKPRPEGEQHRQDRLTQRIETLLSSARSLVLQDRLTGLPNRTFFLQRLSWQNQQSHRHGEALALLFINVDNFKQINETYGHSTGDQVLQQLAADLRSNVNNRAFLARYGGDEFGLILNSANRARATTESIDDDAEQLALDLIEGIQRRAGLRKDPLQISISISIGLALSSLEGVDAEELVRRADRAKTLAKRRRGGKISRFDLSNDHASPDDYRLYNALQADMNQAPERFGVLFQPIVDSNRTLCKVEALARWQSPDYTEVGPELFFAVAERYRLIRELGDLILSKTFTSFNQLRQALGQPELGLAVNISPSQLEQADFAEQVLAQLRQHQLPPAQLTLEVTESAVVERGEALNTNLGILRQAGIRLALDDFGTGFSSLRLLVWLRPDELKIDKSFVLAASTDPVSHQIVLLLQNLAQRMQLTLVAEGVEEQTVLELLQRAGLTRFQGYLFARAQTLEELVRSTASQPPTPAA